MSSLNQRTVQRKFFLQTQIESQSFATKIRTEIQMLPYWNVTNFSLWRCEDFYIVGVVGATEMCLHNSVMLWKICRGFSQWCTEYPNYYSQWPFISISDFFCWVLVCSGSDSRADVSAPWLKLLPSCLSFGTFWFKMLHFFMRTSEGQHPVCLHTLENDDWKETTHQSLWDTYGQLQILCMEMWAPLEVRAHAVPFASCVGTCWICLTTGRKKVAHPFCLFTGNMGDIWNWLCISAVTDFPVHRCACFF